MSVKSNVFYRIVFVATAVCMISMTAYASYKNLIVNGSFDTGSLAPWTRNTTIGRAGQQGSAQTYKRPYKQYVQNTLDCGSHVLGLVSYIYPDDSRYYNSTDTYVVQTVTVEDIGTYLVSFDYVGRAHDDDKYWNNAESYVRIFKGRDITVAPIYTGAFTPISKTVFSHFKDRVHIKEPGVYTFQLFRPEPTGNGTINKCVMIDNVVFARDDADNLIRNGRFDAGSIAVNPSSETVHGRPDADNNSTTSPGYQAGKIIAGHNNSCWEWSGVIGLARRNAGYVADDPLVGELACYMQTYHFANNTYSNSTDACLWQSFAVPDGGTYEVSFDYVGRKTRSSLFGATMYVRLYKGTDRTSAPVYEGSVTPTRNTSFMRFVAFVDIADADTGEYTLEFFQPQPATAGSNNDKAIVLDNVRVAGTGRNLIQNGNFERTPNGTGWSTTGNNAAYWYSRDNNSWIAQTVPAGRCALVIQTYNYIEDYGDSGDKSVWQPFDITAAGAYRLSFDYTGRSHAGLFGRPVRVRVYSGEGIGGAVVFEGECAPAVCSAFQHYANYATLDAGRYTLEFFMDSPKTAGAAETDNAVVIDNVSLESVASGKVVRWTGSVDGDVAKPGNWEVGEVPDADTIAYFAGDFAAQIPFGTAFDCAGVVFENGARLKAACDWRGLKGVAMYGALDVGGNRLVLSGLNGSAAISSSVAGGVIEIATAGAGDLAVNSSVVIDGANIRVEKTGAGMFISKAPQRYSGGTAVKGGTARPLDATAFINDGFKAFGEGGISVEEGATFDARGHFGYGNIFDLAGGTLTSYIEIPGASSGKKGLGAATLSRKSYLTVQPEMDWVFGEDGGVTDLGGNALEVSIGGELFMYGCTIKDGTLDFVYGGWLRTVSGKPVDASTVDVKANCAFNLDADLSVRGYEAVFANNYNRGTAALKVCGTFKPDAIHDYFRGCTMMDGSTVDLSGRTGAWSVKSAFTEGPNVVTFAPGAVVTVNLAGRTDLKSLAKSENPYIIDWTCGEKPDSSVRFVLDTDTHGQGFKVKVCDAGLRLDPPRGMTVLVR